MKLLSEVRFSANYFKATIPKQHDYLFISGAQFITSIQNGLLYFTGTIFGYNHAQPGLFMNCSDSQRGEGVTSVD